MGRLIKIDEYYLPQHKHLIDSDECYFLLNYPPFHSHGRTPANVLIMDFKIDMDRLNSQFWKEKKANAINLVSQMIQQSLIEIWTPESILIPLPPSKKKGHPLYDERIMAVLRNFSSAQKKCDLREIISIKENLEATHKSSKKSPDEILSNLIIDKKLCVNKSNSIILVDDVVSSGAHFKACQKGLSLEFPNANIKGVFIGRTPQF